MSFDPPFPRWQPAPGAAIRPAATLVVLRDAPTGIEVLLLRRVSRDSDVHSGACVFPGGLLDAADGEVEPHCEGFDDGRASALLGLERGGLGYFVAALRECFEEAGLLYASRTDGQPMTEAQLADLAGWREPLNRGERRLDALCGQFGLRLAVDRLAYFSHWLTPPGVPKRYDTRFFVAEAPALQAASQDAVETVEQLWIRPADAIGQAKALHLVLPTLKTLQLLQQFDSVGAVMAHAHTPRTVPCTMPHLGRGAKGVRPVHPDEPAWAELGRLDPQGQGTASFELTPGTPVRLSPRLIRITANNGSMMTGPGTNTYLLGGGDRNEWAAIDPGPDDAVHVQAIVDAAPGPIRWIFVTHTHKDHSPAAAALKARTGAQVLG
ncbi:MAG: MBL fold metallo-hydrolase, partial [Rhizobacter sp.]|nr:MBL fold metallo-hydrolase [Rhizobacter sp.]